MHGLNDSEIETQYGVVWRILADGAGCAFGFVPVLCLPLPHRVIVERERIVRHEREGVPGGAGRACQVGAGGGRARLIQARLSPGFPATASSGRRATSSLQQLTEIKAAARLLRRLGNEGAIAIARR